jgi:hypothetical protein
MDEDRGFLDDLGDWWDSVDLFPDPPPVGFSIPKGWNDPIPISETLGKTFRDTVGNVVGASPLVLIIILFVVFLAFRKVVA